MYWLSITYRILLLALIAIIQGVDLKAQGDSAIGNEWINYSQSYYVVKVAEDGLYKITSTSLIEAGLPPDSIIGDRLAIMLLGEEQSIFTSSKGTFQQDDYILFNGLKNRGELDAELYADQAKMQLNPLYSLYSDTSYYYITLSESTSAKRWELETSTVNDDMPVVPYYWHKETVIYQESHFKPLRGVEGDLRLSQFDTGEGFGSDLKQTHNIDIDLDERVVAGPPAKLTIRHNGNDVDHSFELSVNNQLLHSYSSGGYGVIQKSWKLDDIQLAEENTVHLRGKNGNVDKSSIAFLQIEYPRHFIINHINYSELKLTEIDEVSQIEIQTSIKSELIYIVDLSTNKLLASYSDENGQLNFPITAIADTDHYLLMAADDMIESLPVTPVTFTDYRDFNPDYLILTHKRLSQTLETGRDEIQAYAEYRHSVVGGGHEVLVIDVEQLYHQFSYGVQRHPISIKNFTQHASAMWGDDLTLFIIGKGREYYNFRTKEQISDNSLPTMQVPTFGYPGSDNLLLADRGSITPIFATGRIAANTPMEVRDYLDKVITYESSSVDRDNELWRKRVLHLSGGSSDIQGVVFSFLDDLSEVITEGQVGADVITFQKTSTAPIQLAESQSIIDQINEGVSMITFLGHSAPGTFDFSLEQPEEYDNEKVLPVLLSLGCHSGNIHSEGIGLSEEFVLEQEKGSIAFIASSSSNYIDIQFLIGRLFYALMGGPLYNESIGKIVHEALNLSETLAEGDHLALIEQFTLHGDPALRVYQSDGPDYSIEYSSVRTTPAIISSTVDSITFLLNVINGGTYIKQDLSVRFKIEGSNQSILLDSSVVIEAPAFATQLSLTVGSPGISSTGENILYVTLNENNTVIESPLPAANDNNSLKSDGGEEGYRFNILDNAVLPSYPYPFAIVTEQFPSLIASTSNALAEPQDYLFYLDTISSFDSPVLSQHHVDDGFGMITWPRVQDLIPHTVYYWKVSGVDVLEESVEVRSFVYRPDDESGWHQSHFQQLCDNDFDGLLINENRQLQFDTAGFFISIHNRIYNTVVPPGYQFNFENFAASVNPWLFMDSGVAVVIADPVSGSAWLNEGGSFGSIKTSREASKRVFGYDVSEPASRASLTQLLQHEVPEGHYVFLFTVLTDHDNDFETADWVSDETSLPDLLQKEGALLFSQLLSGEVVPYNFIYQKGRGSLAEEIAEAADGFVKANVFIPRLAENGRMTSTDIGPANSWGRVSVAIDDDREGQLFLSVYGLSDVGSELLFSTDELSDDIDLSMISADEFSYIRLELEATDEVNRMAPSFREWSVYFTGLPDLALDPMQHYVLEESETSDSLQLSIAVINASGQDMPPSEVNIYINDDSIYKEVIPPLFPGEATKVGGSFPTEGYEAQVLLKLAANPLNNPKEKYQSNNIGLIEYDVYEDISAPIVSVLFDQVSIDDGDIVSPSPLISIELKDDNARRGIDDLSFFDIKLQLPSGEELDLDEVNNELSFSSSQSNGASTATILYQALLPDGDYTLCVNARDASGNEAVTYKRLFKVISLKSISDIQISPNPVNRQFNLNFFATGEFSLQLDLYDRVGRLIRSYDSGELGEVRGGKNQSQSILLSDDFGSRFSTGIYYFKLSTTDEGSAYDDIRQQLQTSGSGRLLVIQN